MVHRYDTAVAATANTARNVPYFLPLFREHIPDDTTTTTAPIPTKFPTTLIYDAVLKIMKRCWRIKKRVLVCKIVAREV